MNSSLKEPGNVTNFLVLEKGPTEGIEYKVGEPEKMFSINFNGDSHYNSHCNDDKSLKFVCILTWRSI